MEEDGKRTVAAKEFFERAERRKLIFELPHFGGVHVALEARLAVG
jgi:hypothetical protein